LPEVQLVVYSRYMDDQVPVVDGQVVDEETTEVSTVNGGEVIINMEGMIKNYISSIDKLSEEAKKLKGMLDDIFNNDPTFAAHSEAAKQAGQVKQKTKAEILKRPQAKELDDKIRTLKSEVKENQAALSDYLQEYQRMSGVNEIEGEDGDMREIVYTAKLIKKSFKL
jgi:predicted RNase H-like nuclease (RuvC/YqgF family)